MDNFRSFPGYYQCVIIKDAHIRDETFVVTIPALYAVKNQYEYNPEGNTSSFDGESMLAGSLSSEGKSELTTMPHIIAANHTDYYYRLRGDIFEETMKATQGTTEKRAGGGGDAAYESHDHDIRKPMSLFNFTFENLNNVTIKAPCNAWGFFINASMDKNSFVVTRIQGAVPLKKEALTQYVE